MEMSASLLDQTCFNSSNITISEITKIVDFWPLGFGILVVGIFGLVGNILSATVLSQPRMNSTYSTLSLWLTVVDSVYLLCRLFFYGFTSLSAIIFIRPYYNRFLFPFFGPKLRAISFTAQTASSYLTVVLSIDRYIAACWPHAMKTFCTQKRPHFAAIGVILFASFYNIPRWFEMETKKVCVTDTIPISEETNVNVAYDYYYVIIPSSLRNNSDYKVYYIFWLYFLFLNIIPFSSLSFFNFKIFQAIKKSAKIRNSLTSQQRKDLSFAVMLLTIVLVTLVCNSVFLVTDILNYLKISYSMHWYNLGSFLLTVNASSNFIIYCVCGRNFREQCKITLGRIWNRNKVNSSPSSNVSTNNKHTTSNLSTNEVV